MESRRRARTKNASGVEQRGDRSANPLDLSRLLANRTQREKFQASYLNRKVLTPKYGDLQSFYRFDFPSTLYDVGVDSLVGDKGSYYPNLVRAFYCNLEPITSGFKSWVKGVPIRLSLTEIGQILEIPSEGENIYPDRLCEWEGYNKKNFYLSMCRYTEEEISIKKQRTGTSSGRNILGVGYLSVEDRFMHYILAYVLLPKSSNYSQINDHEMQILYAIQQRMHINWAFLIVNHMLGQDSKTSSLPYARVISRLLEHFGVETSDEVKIDMNEAENGITHDIISKLGIDFDPSDNTYKHKVDIVGAEEEEHQEGENQAQEGGQEVGNLLQEGVTNQMLLDEIRGFRGEFNTFRGYVTERFDNLSTRLDRLELARENQMDEGEDE